MPAIPGYIANAAPAVLFQKPPLSHTAEVALLWLITSSPDGLLWSFKATEVSVISVHGVPVLPPCVAKEGLVNDVRVFHLGKALTTCPVFTPQDGWATLAISLVDACEMWIPEAKDLMDLESS